MQLPWSNIAASVIQPGANVRGTAAKPKAPPSQVCHLLDPESLSPMIDGCLTGCKHFDPLDPQASGDRV